MKIEYKQAVIEDAELLVMTIICDMVRARDMDNQKKRWKNLLANIRNTSYYAIMNLLAAYRV